MAVGDARGKAKILLDQEDGKPYRLEPRDGVADLLHDHRREALGRLVQKQQPRSGAQNPADREHLLLAAGELGALAREALLQIGKQLENLLYREAAGVDLRREQQVLVDIEAREDAALLGAECDAEARDAVG